MTEYICEQDEFDETNQTFYKGEEIVRCRDCEYARTQEPMRCYRYRYRFNKDRSSINYVEPDGFCAWGDHK